MDAELLGCGLDGTDPWIGFHGMAFGLGYVVVCASPPPTCVPPASKTWCFICAGMGPAPCLMLHAVIEGEGAQKEGAFREMGRKISILVLAFWPCLRDHFLGTPAIRQRIFISLLEGGQSHQLLQDLVGESLISASSIRNGAAQNSLGRSALARPFPWTQGRLEGCWCVLAVAALWEGFVCLFT